MKAVILAGGEGTRLRPLTSNQPKPMMPIANRPMMEHIVRLLRRHGFDEIVVTVAFLANQIRTYFGDGSELGVEMRYATEDTPLGTAGSVRNAADELDDTFLVIAGDVLTDIDLGALVAAHHESGALGTIALKRVTDPVDFGIVITREDGRIERFLEKPTWGQVFSDTINTGIYVLEPHVFDFIPAGESVDFSGDVFPAALAKGEDLFGHVVDGYWEDVGTHDAYLRSHQDILDGLVDVSIEGFRMRENIWLGEGAEVDPEARDRRSRDHRTQLPDRIRGPRRRSHSAGRRRRRQARRARDPFGGPRAHVPRRIVPGPRRGAGARHATSAVTRPSNLARCWGTTASSGSMPSSRPMSRSIRSSRSRRVRS